jgi:hypothetical protein
MDRLSDFKPLASVTLPDVGGLPCSGLTLIVGPNSSGKSQFLRDLYASMCGERRALVVASEVHVNKPQEYGPFIECLESEGYLETYIDDSNKSHLRPRTTYTGTGQPVPPLETQQAEGFYQSYDQMSETNRRGVHSFLNHFGRLLVTALFLDRRLTVLNTTGLISFHSEPPQHDFHVLHDNEEAQLELTREINESFGRAVWTDITSGKTIRLLVHDGPMPTAEERHSIRKMERYRTIETEGDGLKSYVTICIALLLGRRPVCIIDEPEMCLHPPQAYNLGRFIGRHGSSRDAATFVATHSSQILRGVVQSSKDVEIIRLTRVNGRFAAHRLAADELVLALSKPTLRAESVLDGIFSESVVVLEADSDRLVYHTAWETLSKEVRLDIHFAAVGGTGGIADICRLYRTLDIPVAVIVDRDIVADFERLHRILIAQISEELAKPLIEKAKIVAEEIRKCPPTIDPSEVKRRLDEISKLPAAWENNDDDKIRQKLTAISQELHRMRRLKSGSLSTLPQNIANPLGELIELLKAVGVFVVPVGELENWLAALRIQAIGPATGDIWDFLRDVGAYLQRANRTSDG